MKLLWVLTIFCSVIYADMISCPHEKAHYHSPSSLLAHFKSGVNDWQSCRALCHGWYKPGKCVIWSFKPSKTRCQLFGDFDGNLVHMDYWITGKVDCYSPTEEKANKREPKIGFIQEEIFIEEKHKIINKENERKNGDEEE